MLYSVFLFLQIKKYQCRKDTDIFKNGAPSRNRTEDRQIKSRHDIT